MNDVIVLPPSSCVESPFLRSRWCLRKQRSTKVRAANVARLQMSIEPVGIVDEALAAVKPKLADVGPEGGCPTCGAKEVKGGCDGNGRMIGGLGGVPGFGWWPIKAYRPCPAFVESGGSYTRKGQSLNEIAFGNADPQDDLSLDERLRGRKRQAGNQGEDQKDQE